MHEKEYQSAMNSFELREEKVEETKRKMESMNHQQTEHKLKPAGLKKFYRIAAAIAILLLMPTTVFAISKNESLINAFFGTENVDDTIIQESIVTDSKTISKDGLRYKIEEYLCDNELGMGFLIYSIEREDGEELTENDKEITIIDEDRPDILLTTNTVPWTDIGDHTYSIDYTMMLTNYDNESTPNKIYRKMYFTYQFVTYYEFPFNKDEADIFATVRSDNESSEKQEPDQLIKLDTSKNIVHFMWTGTENINNLTQIAISPVGLCLEGVGEEDLIADQIKMVDIILNFKDGTNTTLKDLVETSDRDTSFFQDGAFKRYTYFSSILDSSNIKSITINGYEYK